MTSRGSLPLKINLKLSANTEIRNMKIFNFFDSFFRVGAAIKNYIFFQDFGGAAP